MFFADALLSPAMAIAIASILTGLFLFSTLVFVINRYKRCPSNRILVIYGKVRGGSTSTCIHGGAAFVWPVIQDYAFLHLEPIQIGVPLKDALSAENIRVEVPSVFTVAIGTQPEIMQNAAIRLLGLNTAQIKQQAEDIIFGQMRQVIASMRIEDINRDREKFLLQIQHSLEPELKKIGLVLINVNITDIKDESGYIKALGQKAASQALQQARGDVAEQEKEGEIRVAEAERAMAVQVANAAKLREIGMKEAKQEEMVRVSQLNQEQAVRLAEFDRDQQIGEQTAGFQREIQINEADRAKRIAVAEANAKAIAGESKAQADVAAAQADLHVKKADAYQLAETRKREAEAAVLEAQNRAMARAALAEAERVEAEKRAALEAPAKAEKAKTIVEAEAEAERRKISALAEAAAIYAKLEAEARGQYEILAKKGEGLERIISACGGSQQAFQLLMLEHLDVLAQTSAQAISNIKFDKVVVWEQGGNSGQSNTAGFLNGLSRTLPPMIQVLKDVAGIEVPEYLAKLTPDDKPQDTAGPRP